MAEIVVSSVTTTSITVYITGLDASYNNKNRTVYWSCGDKTITTTIPNKISQTSNVTFNKLDEGKKYLITAEILFYGADGGSDTKELTTIATTASSISRPSKFSWTTTKVQGKDYTVTAIEWNDLTKNINEVRAYRKEKGYTVSGTVKYVFTEAVKGEDFTADIFNEAVDAIKGISGYETDLKTVLKGDDVTADLLNTLVNELNSVV